MKRQIIKTRPQRPYTVARVVLVVLACLVALAVIYVLWSRTHAPAPSPAQHHASLAHPGQDFAISAMNPRTPINLS